MIRRTLVGLAAAVAIAAGTSTSLAQVGSAFTYQGQLQGSGSPVNTNTDLQFSLWTASTGGSQVGSTVTALSTPVSSGLFSTSVDFGVNPYTADQALWLQINVRNPAGSGSYVPMGTRQRITAAPFSMATRGISAGSTGAIGIGGAPFDANHSLTLHAVNGASTESILFSSGNGSLWDMTVYDLASGFGNFTLSRSGTDYPFVINGDTGNILLGGGGTGNVGVGTSTPASKLDVAGIGRFSGLLTLASAIPTGSHGSGLWIGGNDSGPLFPSGTPELGIRIFNNSTAPGQSTVQGCNYNLNAPRDIVIYDAGGGIGLGASTITSGFKVEVGGNIRCVNLTQTSSRELKKDIVPLTDALGSIMKLRGVAYAWNESAPEQVRGARDIGFIAEEMNDVLPDIVAKDGNGKPVGIDYGKVTPVAVEAIKQLEHENEQLRARLEKLEALVAAQAASDKASK
jgi:hypothetical protein